MVTKQNVRGGGGNPSGGSGSANLMLQKVVKAQVCGSPLV